MENPFRNIPNELPLVTFQAQVNEALYTMYAGLNPDFFWKGDRALRHAHSAYSYESPKKFKEKKMQENEKLNTPSNHTNTTSEDSSNTAASPLPSVELGGWCRYQERNNSRGKCGPTAGRGGEKRH